MIPVVRPSEPAALGSKRQEKLRTYLHERPQTDAEYRPYDHGKSDLYRAQHGKCAYCEVRESSPKYRDLEHYRPKSRYWWLTWTWENHLFACKECNSDHKKNEFPIADEQTRLAPGEAPPGREAPFLLDPTAEDGRHHLVYRLNDPLYPGHWSVQPRNNSAHGLRTIEVCGLNRPSLIAHYDRVVREDVNPAIEDFAADQAAGRTVSEAFARLWKRVLGPHREFAALAADVVDAELGQQLCTAGLNPRASTPP